MGQIDHDLSLDSKSTAHGQFDEGNTERCLAGSRDSAAESTTNKEKPWSDQMWSGLMAAEADEWA
jgi:hypothetical protein